MQSGAEAVFMPGSLGSACYHRLGGCCCAVSLLLRDIQASRMVRALLKEQATHRAATAKELKEDTISVPDRGKSTAQHSPPRVRLQEPLSQLQSVWSEA